MRSIKGRTDLLQGKKEGRFNTMLDADLHQKTESHAVPDRPKPRQNNSDTDKGGQEPIKNHDSFIVHSAKISVKDVESFVVLPSLREVLRPSLQTEGEAIFILRHGINSAIPMLNKSTSSRLPRRKKNAPHNDIRSVFQHAIMLSTLYSIL